MRLIVRFDLSACILSLCCFFTTSCFAQETPTPTVNDLSSPSTKTPAVPAQSSDTRSSVIDPKKAVKSGGLPKRLAGFITGVFVGTPASAVRKAIDEEKFAVKDMAGDDHSARVTVPCGVLWAPFSVMAGILQSPFVAFTHSLENIDKPFSHEQLGLVEPKELFKQEESDIKGQSER